MKKNILVIISNLDFGGAEKDLLNALPRIDRKKFNVTVCTYEYPGVLAVDMEKAGIPVYAPLGQEGNREAWSKIGGLKKLWLHLKAITYIKKYFKKEKIDLVHYVLPRSYFVGTIAAILAGIHPRVMSRLSLNYYQDKRPLLKWIERKVLHKTIDIAIGNAKGVLKDLTAEGIPEEKQFLLYNGVNDVPFIAAGKKRDQNAKKFDVEKSPFVMTVVANLHEYKGHKDFLEALSLIKDALPKGWKLLCAGRDQGQLDFYRKYVKELEIEKNVDFLGPRNDIPDILSVSDLAILPSHEEGFPISLLESMAASLPIVGTRVGGVPELVAEGKTGYVVPRKDPKKLSEAILKLAKDPKKRKEMGQNGYKRLKEEFSLEKSVKRQEELYQKLLNNA